MPGRDDEPLPRPGADRRDHRRGLRRAGARPRQSRLPPARGRCPRDGRPGRATGLHAASLIHPVKDQRVRVYRTGSIGLLTVASARAQGARSVDVIEPSAVRRHGVQGRRGARARAAARGAPLRSGRWPRPARQAGHGAADGRGQPGIGSSRSSENMKRFGTGIAASRGTRSAHGRPGRDRTVAPSYPPVLPRRRESRARWVAPCSCGESH